MIIIIHSLYHDYIASIFNFIFGFTFILCFIYYLYYLFIGRAMVFLLLSSIINYRHLKYYQLNEIL